MKLKIFFLLILILIGGVVYLYTVAPTLSFWDCGEYIAVSYALGVPHPPGTPFFVIFGRVWVLIFKVISRILPISREVAWHMNLTAVFSSLVSLGFIYIITLKLLRRWRGEDGSIIPYLGAFSASLVLAFSYTFWENAVETEMYAPATAVLLFITYLALRWHEDLEVGVDRSRYLLFIFYLVFLASGIHLAPFLAVVPLFIYIFMVRRQLLRDVYLWLIGLFVVLGFFAVFIASDRLFWPSIILLGLILVVGIFINLMYYERYRNGLLFWVGVLVVVIGFSSELFLIIRANVLTERYKAKDLTVPRINEVDPRTLQTFYDVLHRKQYEPMSILPRRTQIQTGFNAVAGYFEQVKMYMRYLGWQFVSEGFIRGPRVLLLLIFYFLGIWGIYQHWQKDKNTFLFIFLLFFMTSFALMTYLNLKFSPSDPNPAHQPREVRERDYFFHPGFAYFAIFLGIGFVSFIDWVKRYFSKFKFAPYVSMGLILLLPVIPFATHFKYKNRYGNWIPRDYGYNMLACCEDNSLVFTNGDNDTFPLWFVQEVLGYKRSVIVANLSLINTNWYIKQLKYWGAPITFPDRFINTCETWPRVTQDGRVILTKDIIVRHILANNFGREMEDADYFIPQPEFVRKFIKGSSKGKMTIYFATTVSEDNLEGFKPYLRLEGLVYRIVGDSSEVYSSSPGNIETDITRTEKFFYKKMRYTGIFYPEDFPFLSKIIPDFEKRRREGEFINYRVYKDENTRRLLSNYAAGLYALGYEYQRSDQLERTKEAWQWALLFRPEGDIPFLYNLSVLYLQIGAYDSCLSYLRAIEARGVKDAGIYFRIAGCYQAIGNNHMAAEYLKKTIALQPRFRAAYELLVGIYLSMNQVNEAITVLNNWLRISPGDTAAQRMLEELTGKFAPGK